MSTSQLPHIGGPVAPLVVRGAEIVNVSKSSLMYEAHPYLIFL
jgi:hypothetical protein